MLRASQSTSTSPGEQLIDKAMTGHNRNMANFVLVIRGPPKYGLLGSLEGEGSLLEGTGYRSGACGDDESLLPSI